MIKYLVSLACLLPFVSNSQDLLNLSNVTGNMETNLQYLNSDTLIGAAAPEQKAVMNTYMNVNYSLGKFRTGVRFESYLPAVAGYPAFYDGTGIGYRYAQYAGDRLSVTAGNFYEQFGSGLNFRSYEERALGLDNVMDGVNIKFLPIKGIQLKGVFGKQRYRFDDGKVELSSGVVRGVDGELNLNDLIKKFSASKFKVSIGASFISKYQKANNDTIEIPLNIGSYGLRANLKYSKFYLNVEYVKKENDPSTQNGYIYNTGHAALINAGYSTKGFGILLSARSIDNMSFRSDRSVVGNQLMINYLPALSKQHTYNLAGTLYPYAAVPNGEVAYQVEVLYKIPKDSKLGGHYGTDIQLNSAIALNPMRHYSDVDFAKTRIYYKGNLFDSSDSLYFYDFNLHIYRKLSKKFKASLHYFHFVFNNDVNIVTKNAHGNITADIGVAEFQYTAKKHSIRLELQGLFTQTDKGNWATALLEYTFSPHWFVAVMDQYNYGNPDPVHRLHYLLGSFGYSFDNTRFMFSYGKQRAGIVCIGGVCRPVPATNGLTFTFTTAF